MNFLRHLPENPESLASLIEYRTNQVVSMSLSRSEACQLMLMAVSQGEEVTSEEYPGDTLYLVLDGVMPLHRDGRVRQMKPGDAALVPMGVPHAIGGAGEFKILQIIVTA